MDHQNVNAARVERIENEALIIGLVGDWRLDGGLPRLSSIIGALTAQPNIRVLRLDTRDLGKWDSSLVAFVRTLAELGSKSGIDLDLAQLPSGVVRLVRLASSGPDDKGAELPRQKRPLLAVLGQWAEDRGMAARRSVTFLGEAAIALTAFLAQRARFRRLDLLLAVRACGAEALPIVATISLLVGTIFAFVGAVQLKKFGADIYVANLVAVAMTREMAAVMTAIVLAGRTGAAFAAQIGAMQGNEEVDALTTLGISSVEFLVVPRILALVAMTPLLCIYADLMGILGGYLVGATMLNVTSVAYLLQTQAAVNLGDCAIGLFKSVMFGILVAVTGCLRGIECGRSAAAVGDAATAAVVSGILYIIIADAAFAVILNVLGL